MNNLDSYNSVNNAFPSTGMQNQMHELAKTLPAPRKQNTACDACRSRKVRCHRVDGVSKCQHCITKGLPCTNHAQLATSEKKRGGPLTRRPRGLSSGNLTWVNPSSSSSTDPNSFNSVSTSPNNNSNSSLNATSDPIRDASNLRPSAPIPPPVKFGFYPNFTDESPTRDVLAYLFAPPEETHSFSGLVSPYTAWGELAYKFEDETFRAEFANDLLEIFFQIVHSRLPLLDPTQFRERFTAQLQPGMTSNFTSLHPALVAVVVAWGAKFSEHALLVADRRRIGGSSLIAKTLVDRARDLAEALKVHRIASQDHVVICLLLEPLQCQTPEDSQGFHTFWLRCSIQHLLSMRMNSRTAVSNWPDPESRGMMLFAWWMAVIADAYGSVYYRRTPILDSEDYDLDVYTDDRKQDDQDPKMKLEFLGYYTAAHSLARTSRQMSRSYWRPSVEYEGIPYASIKDPVEQLEDWKDKFLAHVGVRPDAEWDFVSAVSSCASDATYHVMWIVLFNAIDEFGVKEQVNEETGNQGEITSEEIDAMKRKICDQACQGAVRIAGLIGVLTSNGYLRLDPAVMHVSCRLSGMLLARLGRPEVSNCILGLRQYSQAYEEASEHALRIEHIYEERKHGGDDDCKFVHMSSTVLHAKASLDAMAVDER